MEAKTLAILMFAIIGGSVEYEVNVIYFFI